MGFKKQALRVALESAEGVGRSLCELTEFSAKTRDARAIRNEHDSAKFQARPSPSSYKYSEVQQCQQTIKVKS